MTSRTDESTQIAKEALTLSASNYLCRVLYLVRGLGVAALLQPEIYGIWSVLKAMQDSTAFSNLGASFALLREVALNKSRGDEHGDRLLHATALNLSLLVTAAVCIVLLALSYTPLMPDIGSVLRISLIVMMLAAVTYYIPRQLQAHRAFYFQARYLLLYAFLNVVFSLLAVYFWGLAEMLWGLVLAHSLAIVYTMRNDQLHFTRLYDSKLARVLVQTGLPVMLGSGLFFFLRAADQFLVYALIGSVASGYYAISNFVAMTVTQIPIALAATLFPRMMERHSGGASRREIEHLFFEPLKILSIGTPVLLGATYFAVEPMLVYLLPDYLPALNVIRIALIGIFFQSVWSLSHSLLLTFEKQNQQMFLALALLAVNIAAVSLAIINGGNVEVVIWVASGVSFLSALVILLYVFLLLERPMAANLATLLHILWPLLYAAAVCLMIDRFVTIELGSLSILIEATAKLAVFGLLSAPLFWSLYSAWRQRSKDH